MNNLYRGPSINDSYHVRFSWPFGFRREDFFRNQPIRNKNCLWRPCLITDRNEMSTVNRGTSIDASYQVSFQLVMLFQRRKLFKNQPIRNKNCPFRSCLLTDQYLYSTFHRCSLTNLVQLVSEEKFYLEINQSETRIACGHHMC